MISFPKLLYRLATVLCLLALSGASAKAARKRDDAELPAAPPPAVSQTVTVAPGETVPVPLGIHGGRGQQLEFLIRSLPKGGKLSPVQSTGLNSAVVQYKAGNEAGADRFTYAVRSVEGVSAPALVTINIVVAPVLPARLVTDEQVDFPDVIAGQKSSGTLTITNKGGGVAEGDVSVTEPWSVDGGTHYHLASGAHAAFRLVFAPDKAGTVQGTATLGPDPKRLIALQGTAKSPLEITPATVEMSAPAGNSTRSGKFRVENRTQEPRVLKITAGSRLLVDAKVTVPPSSTMDVPVFAGADNPMAIDEKLRLESVSWSAELPVRGSGFPPRLKFAAATLDFGIVTVGKTTETTITVENSGGISALAAVHVDPPFELAAAGLEVPAQGRAPVVVHWPTPAPGAYSGSLTVEAGGTKESLPFSITVAAPPPSDPLPRNPAASAATDEKPAPPAAPSDSAREAKKEALASALKIELTASLSPAESPAYLGHYTRAVTSDSVVLEWPVSMKPGPPYTVLERHLNKKPDGTLAISWSTLAAVRFADEPGKHTAEVKGLEPNRMYTIRVNGGSASSEPVFTAQFVTSVAEPLISMQAILIIGLILAFGGVAWWQLRNRTKSGW